MKLLIDIKIFNGSVDVLRYAQGGCITEKNILRKESLAISQITGMPSGRQVVMDGCIHIQQLFFEEI
jgi:hypothetical protein